MDEALKVSNDEINFVRKEFRVPPRLRYEWDTSWDKAIDPKIFKDFNSRESYQDKFFDIEAKTEDYLKNFAKSFDDSKLLWTRFISDPSMCRGASYIHIDCYKVVDEEAKGYFEMKLDSKVSAKPHPECLKIQVSKVGKVAVYANSLLDIEINDAYRISNEWRNVENEVLEKLKEAGFFILTKEQIKQPFAFEFDKNNPIHNSLLDSNLKDYLKKPLLYDFFFNWTD